MRRSNNIKIFSKIIFIQYHNITKLLLYKFSKKLKILQKDMKYTISNN